MSTPWTSTEATDRSQLEVRIQHLRAFAYGIGGFVAVVANISGILEVDWRGALAYWIVTVGSALGVALLYSHGVSSPLGVSLRMVWLSSDVLFFGWLIAGSGGSESPWYPAALLGVTCAALAAGRVGWVVMMVALVGAQLGVVAVLEGAPPAVWVMVVLRALIVYAAALVAIFAGMSLRDRQQMITSLQARDRQQHAEMHQLEAMLGDRAEQVERLSRELREMEVTDRLTGLHNRRYLRERIHEDLASVRRAYAHTLPGVQNHIRNSDLGLVMLDIDGLKEVNDCHGLEGGDEVLVQLAAVIVQAVRGHDSVFRWEGDKILLVLRHVSACELKEAVDRILREVRHGRIVLRDGQPLQVTACAGYTHYPLGDLGHFGWEESVSIASSALVIAKQCGRDCAVGVTEGERGIDREGRREILGSLQAAAAAGYVRLLAEGSILPVELGLS
jgi:diguanylate cyclase (GGDEF)-like protein